MKGGSGSQAAHRASVERQLGRKLRVPPKVEGDEAVPTDRELPTALAYLWEWFTELMGRRTSGVSGGNPLAYTELDAWARLTDRQPTPWEVGLLMRLDDAFLTTTRGGGK